MVLLSVMGFKTFFMGMTVAERESFAARCNTSRQHLTNIAYGKPAGENLCINIERESVGKVRCEQLRPDVDWAVLRNCDCSKVAFHRRTGRVQGTCVVCSCCFGFYSIHGESCPRGFTI